VRLSNAEAEKMVNRHIGFEVAIIARPDRPWPLPNVLEKLADAADILLGRLNYDGHGHEQIALARDLARQDAMQIRNSIDKFCSR